jgi:TonB-dependent receptor
MRRKSLCILVFPLILICAALRQPANAQPANGSVAGSVTDSAKAVLQGAQIELQPTGRQVASNNEGQFSMTDIAAGSYTLTVSFVGLAPFSKSITVTGGQATRVDAELKVGSTAESVTVTAERVHGEADAINRERTAENILQVLPAEVITSLPNANIADAVGRLPSVTLERDEGEGKYVQIRGTEPRYSNVTIDGVNVPAPESGVRQIKLDVVASDLVESVEINKTLLANMDGDGIGGSVNLRTKTAGEAPFVSLFGLGGYTPILTGRGAYQTGGTISQRFGKDKRLGVLFGGTYDWNGRGIDDLEPAPFATNIPCTPDTCGSPDPSQPIFGTYPTMDIREYEYYRARLGFAGSVDYKLSNNSNFYVRGLYSHFNNFGTRWVLTPTINSFTTSQFQGGPDGNMSYNTQIRRPVEVIGSMVAGGRNYFRNSWFTWEVSASRSSSEDHGYDTANFAPASSSPLNSVQFLLNRNNINRPMFQVQNGVNIYDPTQYLLQDYQVSKTYSPQLNLQAAASFDKQYTVGGHYGIFEIGAKVRNAHKFEDPAGYDYTLNDPSTAPLSLFPLELTNNHYYDGSYRTGPLVNFNSIKSFFVSNPSAFSIDPVATLQANAPNQYDLIERISAGYLMNTININRFRIYAGVRFEDTMEDVAGNIVATNPDGSVGVSRLKLNSDRLNVLPSAELRYAVTPDSAIRLAYGRGVARPNFGDLAPDLSLNIASLTGGRNTSSIGNPNLKATTADNYDILFEQYLKPLGIIQGGFFYKEIHAPIVFIDTPGVMYAGFPETFLQTSPVNAGSARLYGFEIAYQQRLTYLPGQLAALGFSGNYSYTNSRTEGIPGRSDHPALQRQAPNTWNISPTYDRGRVSVRLGLSYNQANIFAYQYSDGAALGLKGPLGDQYLYTHLQVDAQASIRLAKGFSAIAYGLNLTNEVFGFYNGSTQYPVQREYYKPTIGGGVRWNPNFERP